MQKLISGVLSLALVGQLTACGTLMYPERKGQTSGKIDVEVAAMNAIGLLFFFIPGIIAFGLDIYNGTIYLPGGKSVQLNEQQLKAIQDNGKVNEDKLKAILADMGLIDKTMQHAQLQARQG